MRESKRLYTEIKRESYYSLYEWTSPERVWKERDKGWYVKYGLIFTAFIALSALLGYLLLTLTIICFAFLWFVQATIPPSNHRHTITNVGIRVYGQKLAWDEIKYFWFSKKDDHFFLNLEKFDVLQNGDMINRRVTVLLQNELSMFEIFEILSKYCDYGDKDEIGFNFIMELLLGSHQSIDLFINREAIKKAN